MSNVSKNKQLLDCCNHGGAFDFDKITLIDSDSNNIYVSNMHTECNVVIHDNTVIYDVKDVDRIDNINSKYVLYTDVNIVNQLKNNIKSGTVPYTKTKKKLRLSTIPTIKEYGINKNTVFLPLSGIFNNVERKCLTNSKPYKLSETKRLIDMGIRLGLEGLMSKHQYNTSLLMPLIVKTLHFISRVITLTDVTVFSVYLEDLEMVDYNNSKYYIKREGIVPVDISEYKTDLSLVINGVDFYNTFVPNSKGIVISDKFVSSKLKTYNNLDSISIHSNNYDSYMCTSEFKDVLLFRYLSANLDKHELVNGYNIRIHRVDNSDRPYEVEATVVVGNDCTGIELQDIISKVYIIPLWHSDIVNTKFIFRNDNNSIDVVVEPSTYFASAYNVYVNRENYYDVRKSVTETLERNIFELLVTATTISSNSYTKGLNSILTSSDDIVSSGLTADVDCIEGYADIKNCSSFVEFRDSVTTVAFRLLEEYNVKHGGKVPEDFKKTTIHFSSNEYKVDLDLTKKYDSINVTFGKDYYTK